MTQPHLQELGSVQDVEAGEDTGMTHVADTCCPPYTKNLCGLAIGNDWDCDTGVAAGGEDCVVCAALARSIGRCPQCGAPCE